MLKSLATILALTSLTAPLAPAANAAGLSPNLSIRSTNTNAATLNGRNNPWGSHPGPAPIVDRSTMDVYGDKTGNLNPGSGGGGSGTTPIKKPNLQ